MHDSATHNPNAAASREPHEPGRRISGRLVLLALALLVAAIMLVGWLAIRYSTSLVARQPSLSWAQRSDWRPRPVRETTLRASPVESLIQGTEWRELTLTVEPAEEAAVRQLAALASSVAFLEQRTRERIEAIRAEQPDLFYASYLLATWHRAHGEDERAETLYQAAFEAAPRAIRQRYINPRNRELAHHPVGRVAVICYRNAAGDGEGGIDESLRLVYPALVTDEHGFVYVPVYRTIYSIGEREPPAGYEVRTIDPGVFQFPGRAGRLEPAMLEREAEAGVPAGESYDDAG